MFVGDYLYTFRAVVAYMEILTDDFAHIEKYLILYFEGKRSESDF